MKAKPTLADAMQRKTEPKATSSLAPSRRGKKAFVLYMEPELSKRLKILAAVNETTVHALALQAIDLLFEQYDE